MKKSFFGTMGALALVVPAAVGGTAAAETVKKNDERREEHATYDEATNESWLENYFKENPHLLQGEKLSTLIANTDLGELDNNSDKAIIAAVKEKNPDAPDDLKIQAYNDFHGQAYVYSLSRHDGNPETVLVSYTVKKDVETRNVIVAAPTGDETVATVLEQRSHSHSPLIPTGYGIKADTNFTVRLKAPFADESKLQVAVADWKGASGSGLIGDDGNPIRRSWEEMVQTFNFKDGKCDVEIELGSTDGYIVYIINRSETETAYIEPLELSDAIIAVPTLKVSDAVEQQAIFLTQLEETDFPYLELVGRRTFATLHKSIIKDMLPSLRPTKHFNREILDLRGAIQR